jgi:hypothetical protein
VPSHQPPAISHQPSAISNTDRTAIHEPDDVVLLGAGMNGMPLVLGKVDQVDSVLLAVENALLCSLLAVVDDDLVILARGDDALAVIAEKGQNSGSHSPDNTVTHL